MYQQKKSRDNGGGGKWVKPSMPCRAQWMQYTLTRPWHGLSLITQGSSDRQKVEGRPTLASSVILTT